MCWPEKVREIGLKMGSKNNLQTNIDYLYGWVATIAMEKSKRGAMEEGARVLESRGEEQAKAKRKVAMICKTEGLSFFFFFCLIYEIHKP